MAEAPFVMHGARAAAASGLAHIEQQVAAIEVAIADNPGLAFDLARTLVESVCRTVLRDRAISFSDTDELPKLFKSVSQSLPFLPPNASSAVDVRESLRRTLEGLSATVVGVCELRNRCGFASHGGDGPRPEMESVQALLAAEAADAIVGFLYRVHRQDRAPSRQATPEYEDHTEFNDWIDEQHPIVRIFDEEFLPSKVLHELASEPYRLLLAEFVVDPETSAVRESAND